MLVSDCCGYLFTANVTLALPAKVLKSGTKRLTAKKISPAMLGLTISLLHLFVFVVGQNQKDLIKDGTIVVEPSSLT